MSELEPAIRQLFDATNRGDSEAFLDAFAPDGVVDDWGRTFTGREAIAGWNANENIGVNSHIDVTGVERDGDASRSASPSPATATTAAARSPSRSRPTARSPAW